jgi:YihY family inner membrane protein
MHRAAAGVRSPIAAGNPSTDGKDPRMAGENAFDQFQRRNQAAGFPLAVLYKYFDDSGPYLAALITYYGVVSLFPILLLMSTVLGVVLVNHPHLQHQVINSALAQFPVVGNDLGTPKRLSGGAAGVVLGIIGALYGGLGVGQAVQYAMNTAWRVPRNSRPNPLKSRGRSVVLLLVAGLSVIATTVLPTVASAVGAFGWVSQAGVVIGSVVVNSAVFLFVFRFATVRPVSLRDVAVGAVIAAVGWQVLQSFGSLYVNHVVRDASATNGVFALVLGMLGFVYLAASLIMLCVEINVVRVDRLHPRSLLTPFTDNVRLTPADERAYTEQAQAERTKGFQDIDVSFRDH